MTEVPDRPHGVGLHGRRKPHPRPALPFQQLRHGGRVGGQCQSHVLSDLPDVIQGPSGLGVPLDEALVGFPVRQPRVVGLAGVEHHQLRQQARMGLQPLPARAGPIPMEGQGPAQGRRIVVLPARGGLKLQTFQVTKYRHFRCKTFTGFLAQGGPEQTHPHARGHAQARSLRHGAVKSHGGRR